MRDTMLEGVELSSWGDIFKSAHCSFNRGVGIVVVTG